MLAQETEKLSGTEADDLRQNALFKAHMEASPDGIIINDDATAAILYCNRRFMDMWGIPARIIESRSSRRAIQFVMNRVADRGAFVAVMEHSRTHPLEPMHGEIALKDGRTFERHSAPVYDSRGAFCGRMCHYRDITARKRTEESLRESEQRFRQLAEGIHEVFWLTASDRSKVIYVSPSYEKTWGRSRASLYAAPDSWMEPIHPADRGSVLKAAKKQARGGYNVEYRIIRPDGSVRWINDRAFPIKDQSNKIYRIAGIAEDITSRKKAAETETLREREAMQRDFIANVSHEFRTPVAAIKGFAETLILGGLEDTQHRLKFSKAIERQANRLSQLVEDLLELSSLESGKRPPRPETIPLAKFLREAAAGVALLARKNRLQIRARIDRDIRVKADPDHLARVFQHLCENAIKYNRRGGRIEIEGRLADGMAGIAVKDTGRGISAKDLPHIFERFYRSKRSIAQAPNGTGLGLSIVKQSVEANGGRVWVESARGKGSTFRFTLPLAR